MLLKVRVEDVQGRMEDDDVQGFKDFKILSTSLPSAEVGQLVVQIAVLLAVEFAVQPALQLTDQLVHRPHEVVHSPPDQPKPVPN